MPDDQIIPKGKQIAVIISSSDQEFTLWPKQGTELVIDPNYTTISIPIVGGINEYHDAVKNSFYKETELKNELFTGSRTKDYFNFQLLFLLYDFLIYLAQLNCFLLVVRSYVHNKIAWNFLLLVKLNSLEYS